MIYRDVGGEYFQEVKGLLLRNFDIRLNENFWRNIVRHDYRLGIAFRFRYYKK